MDLKYLIIGAGALGGNSAALLTKAGKNVTLIARGENYEAIKKDGLHITRPTDEFQVKVRVSTWEEYKETPDIIMVAIKAYSLDSIIPHLDRICGENTIIFPVSNSLDLGGQIESRMSAKCTVIGGVAYVGVARTHPGHIEQQLPFYKIVLAMRNDQPVSDALYQIQEDFNDAGIKVLIKNNPIKNALRKFFRVSVFSAVNCYYDTTIGPVRESEEGRELFFNLTGELVQIAKAMGDPFGKDDEEPFPGMPVQEESIQAFMNFKPEYQTSMKYDWDHNHQTEIREQILDVIDLGENFGLPMTSYRKVARKMIEQKPDQVSPADRIKYAN